MIRVRVIQQAVGAFAKIGFGLLLTWLLLEFPVRAHRPSDGWLQLTVTNQNITLQLDLALKDLDVVLGLDTSDDGKLTWGDLRRREPDLNEYITRHLTLTNTNERLRLIPEPLRLVNHEEVMCASLMFTAAATATLTNLTLTYRCLFDTDPQHRAFIQTIWQGAVVAGVQAPHTNSLLSVESFTGMLSPSEPSVTFTLGSATVPGLVGSTRGFSQFLLEGIHHIWSGYDHLMFLAALLLPSVLMRGSSGWQPIGTFREALTVVLQVVTAFTIAHSLTLALAALGVARPPSRFIESAIAASVFYAAVRNLIPAKATVAAARWTKVVAMPFGFGLIHGFGFANALGELGLAGSALAVPLVGFNLGVEAGQLVAVAAFLPIAFVLRGTQVYRRGILPLGSIMISLTAAAWLIDRAFGIGFMPF